MLHQYKKKAAYLAALSIFFGALELFIPKVLPFFRLGLANIPILLALDMPFKPFILLLLLKGIGNSYIAGNLFSFFALISIAQSLSSGISMYLINKANPSPYATSALGALASTLTQIFLAMLYIGKGVLSFLPLMLSLSLASSVLVAFLSSRIKIDEAPELLLVNKSTDTEWLLITLLILSSLALMLEANIAVLLLMALLSLLLQRLAGRRIMLIPHITIFIFMLISALLTPNGRVLINIGSFSVTEGALIMGIEKALKLSGTIALSQAYSRHLRPGENILGETLSYFTALLSAFRREKGTLKERAMNTLSLKTLEENKDEYRKAPDKLFIAFTVIFIILLLIPVPVI